MKILITGVCGFVGSSLARFLRETFPYWEVFGLDNFIRPGSEYNRLDLKKRGIKLFHADLRVTSDFESLPGVDYVIDAAANPSVLAGVDGQTSSRQLVEHNLWGTVNILEYCKALRSGFILLSTSRVYSIPPIASVPVRVQDEAFVPELTGNFPMGLTAEGLDETFSVAPPVSLYGSTKLASEALALEYGETFDFPVWINRCGVLAGGGQFARADQGIFSYWLHSWKNRHPLRYIDFQGQGHQVRDCLHPQDLGRLLVQQIQFSGTCERLINISGGASHAVSLRQLSKWCASRWGEQEVQSDPKTRPFDLPWVVLDSRKAAKLWNWTPQISQETILEEIARHTESNPDWLDISAP